MKAKYIGLGEYPNIHIMKKYREQCSEEMKKNKEDIFIYFSTSKGMKKRKLFNIEK